MSTDPDRVAAALAGDRDALEDVLRRTYDRIFPLCVRLLGDRRDAEDAAQDALLSIVRALPRFDGRAAFTTWTYRIATNACLDELARRPRRVLASDLRPAADPAATAADPLDEALWLEPMPDAWLSSAPAADPAARYGLRESVALAFIAALQVLSPS